MTRTWTLTHFIFSLRFRAHDQGFRPQGGTLARLPKLQDSADSRTSLPEAPKTQYGEEFKYESQTHAN